MAVENQSGNLPMEASGESRGLGPAESGQTLEQAESSPAEEASGAEVESPEGAQPPAKEAATDDDIRLMTDEELAALPPELQKDARALRKRLLTSYNKRMQSLSQRRDYAQFGERFATDPDYRQAVMRQYGAAQPAAQPQAQPAAPAQVPPQYLEMRKRTLPAEMQWMAESLALGDYQRDQAFYEQHVRPMQAQTIQERQTALKREWDGVVGEFAERNPGWEQHEEEMTELVNWLRDSSLKHPRFGTKLDALYKLRAILSGEDLQQAAVQKQIETTAKAARNKSVTTVGGRGTQSNLEDRIRDRKLSNAEAFRLATQDLRGRG